MVANEYKFYLEQLGDDDDDKICSVRSGYDMNKCYIKLMNLNLEKSTWGGGRSIVTLIF